MPAYRSPRLGDRCDAVHVALNGAELGVSRVLCKAERQVRGRLLPDLRLKTEACYGRSLAGEQSP